MEEKQPVSRRWAEENLTFDEVIKLIDAQLKDEEKIIIAGGEEEDEPIFASQLCLQWFPFLSDHRDEYVPNHPSIVRITQ